MDNKTIFLGLVTLGALAFASYLFITQQSSSNSHATPQATIAARTVTSPLATAVTSASPSPSNSAATSTRTFSDRQLLSLPNTIETIEPGGGLLSIATAHEISITDLAALNGIKDANKVIAGQSIIVPDSNSGGSLIILYVLNAEREKKEDLKIKNGGISIYSDPITAAQTDTKGIADLSADTPYSRSNETDKTLSLSSTVNNRIYNLSMEKTSTGLWIIKKLSSKPVSGATP